MTNTKRVIESLNNSHIGIEPNMRLVITNFALDELAMFVDRLRAAGIDPVILLEQYIQFAGTIEQRIEFKPGNGRFFPRG